MDAQTAAAGNLFQPTLPLRGATGVSRSMVNARLVSTHAPLAGSDGAQDRRDDVERVSTHAPLAGSDVPL